MCVKAPKQPPLRSTPTTDQNATIVQQNRRRSADQSGVDSNIFTSALGDAGYNMSTSSPALARFGA